MKLRLSQTVYGGHVGLDWGTGSAHREDDLVEIAGCVNGHWEMETDGPMLCGRLHRGDDLVEIAGCMH